MNSFSGFMYGIAGSYEPAFFMAGGLTFIGVCILFFVPAFLPPEIVQQWKMRSMRQEIKFPSSENSSSVPSEKSKTWSLNSDDEALTSNKPKSFSTYASIKTHDTVPKVTFFKEEEEEQQNRLSLILEQYFSMQQLVNQRDSLLSRIYSSENLYERIPYTTNIRETDV